MCRFNIFFMKQPSLLCLRIFCLKHLISAMRSILNIKFVMKFGAVAFSITTLEKMTLNKMKVRIMTLSRMILNRMTFSSKVIWFTYSSEHHIPKCHRANCHFVECHFVECCGAIKYPKVK